MERAEKKYQVIVTEREQNGLQSRGIIVKFKTLDEAVMYISILEKSENKIESIIINEIYEVFNNNKILKDE